MFTDSPPAQILAPPFPIGDLYTSFYDGYVFHDFNQNNMFDFGEGIPDFMVFKDNNNNGEFDSTDDWRTTDSNGYFFFSYDSCKFPFLNGLWENPFN